MSPVIRRSAPYRVVGVYAGCEVDRADASCRPVAGCPRLSVTNVVTTESPAMAPAGRNDVLNPRAAMGIPDRHNGDGRSGSVAHVIGTGACSDLRACGECWTATWACRVWSGGLAMTISVPLFVSSREPLTGATARPAVRTPRRFPGNRAMRLLGGGCRVCRFAARRGCSRSRIGRRRYAQLATGGLLERLRRDCQHRRAMSARFDRSVARCVPLRSHCSCTASPTENGLADRS